LFRDLAADSLAGNAFKKAGSDRKRSPPVDPPSASDTANGGGAVDDEMLNMTPAKRAKKHVTKKNSKKVKARTSPKPKRKSAASPPVSMASVVQEAPPMPLPVSNEEGDSKPAPSLTPTTSLKPAPKSSFAAQSPHAAHPPSTLPGNIFNYRASPTSLGVPVAAPQHPPPLVTHRPSPHMISHPSSHGGSHSSPYLIYIPSPHTSNGASPHPHYASPHSTYHSSPHQSHSTPYDVPGRSQTYDPSSIRLGTLESLLAAAESDDKEAIAVHLLRNFKSASADWPESDQEEPKVPEESIASHKKGEFVKLPNGFVSALPPLLEEPLYEGPLASSEKSGDIKESIFDDESTGSGKDCVENSVDMEVDKAKPKTRVVSNVLEYPYPIDVWWPSMIGVRRERRTCCEESDEDAFEEEPSSNGQQPALRTNLRMIKKRLANDLRPGVLEKIPHCKLHRLLMRKKKNLAVPDLVFCWQVTDIYPNDIMVCCSRCGAWRHAACGGHWKPYSVRENTKSPFVAVCDHCHAEEETLRDFPHGEKRLERQRMEQIRRALATTAVMRHASFSKHGGTYKWPLGRVSATHITGHTRSVNARHEKAEKQWADMVKRLSSGYGHRPRERARVRTKELERLLVSVEDAGKSILFSLCKATMNTDPNPSSLQSPTRIDTTFYCFSCEIP
jgi:hypothetical protein